MDGWFYLWRESSTRINTMSHNILLWCAHDLTRTKDSNVDGTATFRHFYAKYSFIFVFSSFESRLTRVYRSSSIRAHRTRTITVHGGVSGWRRGTKEQTRRCKRSRSDFRMATIMGQSSCFHFVCTASPSREWIVCKCALPPLTYIFIITYLLSCIILRT